MSLPEPVEKLSQESVDESLDFVPGECLYSYDGGVCMITDVVLKLISIIGSKKEKKRKDLVNPAKHLSCEPFTKIVNQLFAVIYFRKTFHLCFREIFDKVK